MSTTTDRTPTGDELQAMKASGIRIWEDNGGGIYLEPVGTGWMVAGGDVEPGMALTDARLWGEWDVYDEDVYPAETDDMVLVAELTADDEWTTYDDRMGYAARRYCFGRADR